MRSFGWLLCAAALPSPLEEGHQRRVPLLSVCLSTVVTLPTQPSKKIYLAGRIAPDRDAPFQHFFFVYMRPVRVWRMRIPSLLVSAGTPSFASSLVVMCSREECERIGLLWPCRH